jgi:polysaccharide chain length determinant protein (PEP-CTERM system associated)
LPAHLFTETMPATVHPYAESIVKKLHRVARIVANRRWLALAVAVVVGLGFVALSRFVPERFEARARIYVDTQTVLKPLMAGLTYQPDIDGQVQMLARTLVSRPNVERLIDMPELKFEQLGGMSREKLVSVLMSQIKVDAAGKGNVYDISYRGTSPQRAQGLVEATVNMFVRSGLDAKRQDSADAGRFIQSQIASYEAKLVQAEDKLKEFKVRNFSTTGVSDRDYFTRVSALSEVVDKLRGELVAAEQSRDAFKRELAAEDPLLPLSEDLSPKSLPPALVDASARLDTQKRQLDELLERFTDAHPDVIAARRVFKQLESELKERKEAEERAQTRAASGKGGRAATSPVYQKLRVALAETEALVASLRAQLSTQQGRLDQVRSVAGRLPQVEAELAQMNRDYEILRKTYETMVARRESAALGVKLDESSQLAEFRLVEPPRVSSSPVFPGRLHLALLAIAASAVLGCAAALLAEGLHPTVLHASDLRRYFPGRPVIGTVSSVVTDTTRQELRAAAVRFAAVLGLFWMMQGAWVLWVARATTAG